MRPGLGLLALPLLAGVLVAASGCPPVPPVTAPPQQCPASSLGTCRSDRDCPPRAQTRSFCDKTFDGADFRGDGIAADVDGEGCCVVIDLCTSDTDCVDGAACDVRRGLCSDPLACDPSLPGGGACPQRDGTSATCCGDDAQLCEYNDGRSACFSEPNAAAACFVVQDHRRIAAAVGDTEAAPALALDAQAVTLAAVGTDGSGALVAHASFAWAVAGGAGDDDASIGDDGVFSGTCASGVCAFTVTATAQNGGARCDGVVEVYAPPAADQGRVILVDADSGERLAGVAAVSVVGGAFVDDVTGDDGAVLFDPAASAISVFPGDHDWHTVLEPAALALAGAGDAGDTGAVDLIVATRANVDAQTVAGISGTFDFDDVHTTGDVRLGLAGLAVTDLVDDLPRGPASLLGPSASVRMDLEGVTDPGGQRVDWPSNAVMELGTTAVVGDFTAFARRAGPTAAWAIGGQLALADVGPIISALAGGGDVDTGNVLAGVLPFFAKLDHAAVTGLDLAARARPRCDNGGLRCADLDEGAGGLVPTTCDAATGLCVTADGAVAPVDTAAWGFDDHTLAPNTLLALSADYAVPPLPAGSIGAVVVTGVDAGGVGFLPLGVTAGLDDPDEHDDLDQRDGLLDARIGAANAPAKGHVVVDYAPPHDGLEGQPLVTVAFAVGDDFGVDGGGVSAVVDREKHLDGAGNAFPAGAFLPLPRAHKDGATVSFDDDVPAEGAASADLVRVTLTGAGGAWHLWTPAAPDTAPPALVLAGFGAPLNETERTTAARALFLRADAGAALFDLGASAQAWSTAPAVAP